MSAAARGGKSGSSRSATKGGSSAASAGGSRAALPRITLEEILKRLKAVETALLRDPHARFADHLEKSGIRSPVVFVGPDHLRTKRLIEWTREHLFLSSRDAALTYFGSDLGSAQSADAVRTALAAPSLFTPRQLVVLYEADKVKAAAAAAITPLLTGGSPHALVMLTTDAAERKTGLGADAARIGTTVAVPELQGEQLVRWIQREASRIKQPNGQLTAIDEDAAELLGRSWGANLTAVAHEIEKLALLTDTDGRINRKLVERISYRTGEVASFEIVKHIAKRNVRAAVALSHELVSQGSHPLQLNAFLTRALSTLLANHPQCGRRAEGDLGNPWFLRNLAGANGAFSVTELAEAIRDLATLDMRLKDSRLDGALALTLAIERISERISERRAA